MNISFAKREDLKHVSIFLNRWAQEMGYEVSIQDIEDDLTRFVDSGIVICISDKENGIVGIMSGNIHWHFWVNKNIAHEHFFFVRPDFRKKGIGKVLVETFCKWAELSKCNHVIVSPNYFGSVNPDNIKNSLCNLGFKIHGYSLMRDI